MHVIKLNGYNATTENGEKLELGTFDSYGEEQLQIVEAPDWVNLSVIATFNPPLTRSPFELLLIPLPALSKFRRKLRLTCTALERLCL
jgi:hypothetical protein